MTHPFHPLCGQRLAILFERRYADGRLYVCEGGPHGTIGMPEDATDRAPAPATTALTTEVLVELVAVVAALEGHGVGRCPEPVLESHTSS